MKIVGKNKGILAFKEVDQRDESTLRPAYERVYVVREEDV